MGVSPRFPEEEALRRRAAWSDEWRAVARSTAPADRPRAEAAVRSLYAASGRAAPEVRWVPSPRAGLLAYGLLVRTHRAIVNPHATGDPGNGANREFNGLADPFGLEPAWVARLAGQVARGGLTRPTGGMTEALRDGARGLGLAGTVRSLLAVRAALEGGRLELARPADPDPAAVDAAASVLGEAWESIVGSVGADIARVVLADALRRLAESVLHDPAGRRRSLQAMQPGLWDATAPVLAAASEVYGGHLWRHRRGREGREAAVRDRLEIARSAGPWWALEGVALVSERPLVSHVDDEGRPHHPSGPALAWPDGFTVHAVHGVVVDRDVVEDPASITVARIDGEANAEVRRVLVERFGLDRLVREGGATLVAEDDTGRLWRRELGDAWRRDEPVVVVEVRNSTPEPDGTCRTYLLRVPPTTRTAREGVAWTFGLGSWEYRPSRET